MGLLKRTYALPPDTLEQFEQVVEPGKRSAVVSAALREWLDERRREQLRREVVEGCREMADAYLKMEQEYHSLEEEVHRALVPKSQARRRRASPARSRRRVRAGR